MKHYDDDGTPTYKHEMLVRRAYGLSTRLYEGGYVRHVRVTHTGVDSGKFRIRLAERFPRNLDWMARRNRELVEYAMDDLTLNVVRGRVGYFGELTIHTRYIHFNAKALVVDGEWELRKTEG